MPRYKLIIEYDGRPFVGWQWQKNGLSVQETIETAITGFSNEIVRLHAAGRTDSGVHARGQVAHVDLVKNWRPQKFCEAINAHLKFFPVSIINVTEVAPNFEARFNAVRRHYLYRILNRRAPATLDRGLVWHIKKTLDKNAMQLAAQALVGRHDFTTFRAAECQAHSPIRTLEYFDVSENGEILDIRVSAQSFLHHQVRSMVGSLEHVGSGKWRPEDIKAALDARDRKVCGPVAPPTGLYLMSVDYS